MQPGPSPARPAKVRTAFKTTAFLLSSTLCVGGGVDAAGWCCCSSTSFFRHRLPESPVFLGGQGRTQGWCSVLCEAGRGRVVRCGGDSVRARVRGGARGLCGRRPSVVELRRNGGVVSRSAGGAVGVRALGGETVRALGVRPRTPWGLRGGDREHLWAFCVRRGIFFSMGLRSL